MRKRCRLTSHRHAAHHVDLKPQSASKKAFKEVKRRIIRSCHKVEARIRGFEIRKHSPNYGALDKLFKKAVSVSVDEGGELLIINIPQY
jgi:hypothetical protein